MSKKKQRILKTIILESRKMIKTHQNRNMAAIGRCALTAPTIKFNTIEWENGANFAPEYLYEIGVAA